MSDETSEQYRAGDTALIAVVKEAEPLVADWRRRFDSSASAGVPAHVTVLVPFLNAELLDAETINDLTALFGRHDSFGVQFERCGRFPDVLFLVPTPDQPFRKLTEAVAARWPEAPPYGGQFTEVIPHLTVAHGRQGRVLDETEAALTPQLPFAAEVASISLFVNDGDLWRQRWEFPLLGGG
jgi:2'-5' RNA ligase